MTRLIQISDTHVVDPAQEAPLTVDTARALEAIVETVAAALPAIAPVEMALFSGDLTEYGSPGAFAAFRALADRLPVPYRAIPGNHDRREAMRAAFGAEAWMPAEGPIRWQADLAEFTVLGLDTLVDGAPHGALGAGCLDWLAARLGALAPRPVMVALHHPPVRSGIAPMDAMALREPGGLRTLLDAYPGPARLVCGHVHRSIVADFGRTPCIVAPGASHALTLDLRPDNPNSLMEEPGAILVHEYDEGFRTHLLPIGPFPGPHGFY